jgi:acyl-CoA hydrolase
MPDPYTAIQIVMMPRDTNPHGTIFGWRMANDER